MSEMFHYHVKPEDPCIGQRMDVAIHLLLPEFSRSKIAQAIRGGRILKNQSKVRPKTILAAGDFLEADLSYFVTAPILPEKWELPILYEDDYLMAINKPFDTIVHPTETVRKHTLVNYLLGSGRELSQGSHPDRPGIVHRLDAQTTGVILIAKNELAHERLASAFREHRIQKEYLAICEGRWHADHLYLEQPIGRNPKNPQKRAVLPDGKNAISIFHTLALSDSLSFLKVQILTGRTHQIRVHASYMGHPIAGDELYGFRKSRFHPEHQLLHAFRIHFTHPVTGKKIRLSAMPDATMMHWIHAQGFTDAWNTIYNQ